MRRSTNISYNIASKCFTARIMRDGELHSENFSLAKCKSKGAAKKAATAWVNTLKSSLPPPMTSKNRKTRRNSSGVVGVHIKRSARRGMYHYAWHAFWPGRPGGVCRGILKYGNERAFVCAAISRQLETVDRNRVEQEYLRIKRTPEYRGILRRKQSTPL
jgi:hypothetical protein